MSNRFLHLVFISMVHSGVAFAPCVDGNDLLDSTAFNVALFAMGWAVTRWMNGIDMPRSLQWYKASASPPRIDSLCAEKHSISASTYQVAEETLDRAPSSDKGLETHFLTPETEAADNLVVGVGALLNRRMSSAQASEIPPWRRSCFHSRQSNDMSFADYVAHVHWFCECSSPCLVLALIYLDRALSRDAKVAFTSETCHRLFLASLVAALKFHDDDYVPYPNSHYADAGLVSLEDMNTMEKHFCKAVGWQFHVGPEEYRNYHSLLVNNSIKSREE